MKNIWSKEDENYLKNNYKNIKYKEIAAVLNKSEKSIREKVGRMKNKTVQTYDSRSSLALSLNEIDKRLSAKNIKRLEVPNNTRERYKFECLICHYGKNGEWKTSLHNVFSKVGCKCSTQYANGSLSKKWKGVGEISKTLWNSITRGAKLRGHSFEITIEEAWKLFKDQNRKCALSGLELNFNKKQRSKERTASLDRIDSSKGYTKDNIQWIHRDINIMKNVFNEEKFIELCSKIASHRGKSK